MAKSIVGSGLASGAPAPIIGNTGIENSNTIAASEPQGSLLTIATKINKIMQLANDHNVSIGGVHSANYDASNTTIKQWHVGNPYRFNKGLEIRKVTTTTTTSNYYTYILDVLEELGWGGVKAHSEGENHAPGTALAIQEDNSDYYYDDGDLIAVPIRQMSRQYAPIFRILNFQVSLTNPFETQSRYLLVNLSQGPKDTWRFLCNIIVWWIFQQIDKSNIRYLCLLGRSDVSKAIIQQKLKEAGNAEIDDNLADQIIYLKQTTKLFAFIIEFINLQLNVGVEFFDLAKVKITGNTLTITEQIKDVQSLMRWDAAFESIVNTIKTDTLSKFFACKLVSTTIRNFEFGTLGQGAAAMVAIRTTTNRLSSDYTMCNTSVQTQVEIAENYIHKMSPLTRVVKWPVGDSNVVVGGDVAETKFNRIQIPTTNWDDIRRVYMLAPKKVKQIAKTQTFLAVDARAALETFDTLTHSTGVRTIKMSFSALRNKATIEMTAITTA